MRTRFSTVAKRIDTLDWSVIESELTGRGYAHIPGFLRAENCQMLIRMFDRDDLFARSIVMAKEQFGVGCYRYFDAPMPDVVDAIRRLVYPRLAPVANRWQRLLNEDLLFPMNWESYRVRCQSAGQTAPTPILLKYEAGGFNALHRDIRGAEFFPIRLVVVLSPIAPIEHPNGFTGGEFLISDDPERRNGDRRRVAAGLGDVILFCTRSRPVELGGAWGLKAVKHGLDRVESGMRFALGIPFHEYE